MFKFCLCSCQKNEQNCKSFQVISISESFICIPAGMRSIQDQNKLYRIADSPSSVAITCKLI